MQFGQTFTETTIFIHEDKYESVSKNPESSSLSLKLLAGFPVFTIFKDELELRKSLKAFFITKYCSERFFFLFAEIKYRLRAF